MVSFINKKNPKRKSQGLLLQGMYLLFPEQSDEKDETAFVKVEECDETREGKVEGIQCRKGDKREIHPDLSSS